MTEWHLIRGRGSCVVNCVSARRGGTFRLTTRGGAEGDHTVFMANDQATQTAFELEHDAWGRLILVMADGQRHWPVEPLRTFPISDPDRWIAICDAEGRELATVEDLRALGSPVREVLERDLARREFVPQVRRILSVPADAEPSQWEVETDRGNTRFVVNSHDDIRKLGPHRALVIDSQGIRYLIDDVRQLDPASRRVVERFM